MEKIIQERLENNILDIIPKVIDNISNLIIDDYIEEFEKQQSYQKRKANRVKM